VLKAPKGSVIPTGEQAAERTQTWATHFKILDHLPSRRQIRNSKSEIVFGRAGGGMGEGQGGHGPPRPQGGDQRLRFREVSLEVFSSESCFLRAVLGGSVIDFDRRESLALF